MFFWNCLAFSIVQLDNSKLRTQDIHWNYKQVLIFKKKKALHRTSQVVQWLRIHLPMQRAWVQSLVWADFMCHGATNLVYHNYWAHALEPVSPNYWAHSLQLLKPECPGACALQPEKPSKWEVQALQLDSSPQLPQLEKPVCNNEDPTSQWINK